MPVVCFLLQTIAEDENSAGWRKKIFPWGEKVFTHKYL